MLSLSRSASPAGAILGPAAGTCCGSVMGGEWQARLSPPAGWGRGQAGPSSGWARGQHPWRRAEGSPWSRGNRTPVNTCLRGTQSREGTGVQADTCQAGCRVHSMPQAIGSVPGVGRGLGTGFSASQQLTGTKAEEFVRLSGAGQRAKGKQGDSGTLRRQGPLLGTRSHVVGPGVRGPPSGPSQWKQQLSSAPGIPPGMWPSLHLRRWDMSPGQFHPLCPRNHYPDDWVKRYQYQPFEKSKCPLLGCREPKGKIEKTRLPTVVSSPVAETRGLSAEATWCPRQRDSRSQSEGSPSPWSLGQNLLPFLPGAGLLLESSRGKAPPPATHATHSLSRAGRERL